MSLARLLWLLLELLLLLLVLQMAHGLHGCMHGLEARFHGLWLPLHIGGRRDARNHSGRQRRLLQVRILHAECTRRQLIGLGRRKIGIQRIVSMLAETHRSEFPWRSLLIFHAVVS